MRKLFSLFAAVLFAGSMMAADARLTLDFTQSAWGFPDAYLKDAANYTNGGYTVAFNESNNGHKYLTVSQTDLTQTGIIFGKQGATLSFPALDFAVSKILVYYVSAQGGASTVHNIFVGENAVSTAETGCKVTETKSYSTFNIAANAQAAGNVYVLKVTSAHNMQVSKVEFYEAVAGAPEEPTFSVAEGVYTSVQSVELACATEGAEIFYTTDGSDPTAESFQYTTAIPVIETTTIKAVAIKDAVSSGIASATYTIIALDGAGTKEDPFSVADVVKLANSKSDAKYWVMGYIVGCAGNGGAIGDDAASNIALGDAADQQEGLVPVQLPAGAVRDALNIVDNPSNKGKQVKVHGDLQAYFSYFGIKNVDEFELIDDDPQPMAQVSVIEFTAEAAKGTLNDSIFFSEDSLLKLVATDTDNKMEIDANNAIFGDANAQEPFAYRLKSGGKSSAKNNLKLTAAVDGKLLIAARTSTASDTTRTVVLVQEGDTLYNELVLEKDTLPGKIYPFIMVDVKAGDIAVTYPVGAINFYTFALVVEETPIESDTVKLEMNNGYVSNEYFEYYGSTDVVLFNIPVVNNELAGDGDYLDISLFPEDPNHIAGYYDALTTENLDIEYTYLMRVQGTDTTEIDFVDGIAGILILDPNEEMFSATLSIAACLTAEDGTVYSVEFAQEVYYDFIETEEGLEEILSENSGKTIKFVQNGQVYILKGNKVYGIRGELIR